MITPAILAGLVATGITGLGLLVAAAFGDKTQRWSGILSISAAGMLLTMLVFHIVPEALAFGESAPLFMVAGILCGLAIQNGVGSIAGGVSRIGLNPGALASLLAIALHSLLDGSIYSVSFSSSVASGVYTAAALMIHEVPEAFVAFALARQSGANASRAALYAFLAAGVTTPVGALVCGPLLATMGPASTAALFAVSAGLLMFVAAGPLLAPLLASPRAGRFAALAAGSVAAGLLMVAPLNFIGVDERSGPVHAHVHDHGFPGHSHPHGAPFR